MTMRNAAQRLRRAFDVSVRGAPRWHTQYVGQTLYRLKWFGVAALVLWLIQALILCTLADDGYETAARNLGVSTAALILPSLAIAVLGTLFVLVPRGNAPLGVGAALNVARVGIGTAIAAEAILRGVSTVSMERMASFDLTLMVAFAIAPLPLVELIGLTALAIAVSLAATLVADLPLSPLAEFGTGIHAVSFAMLGIVFNRWYLGTFRTQWLAHLRLARRTRQLEAQKRRIEALVDDLTEANLSKTRFLAAASHDLRQPMHAIGMLVGVLRQYVNVAEVRRIFDTMEASVEALDNLFNTLLDVSKLDAGIVTPKMAEFAIAPLLSEMQLQFGAHAEQKGLSLRVAPSRVIVRSDQALLRQIVMNLVANAVRYTARGRVLVGCKRDGARIRIRVVDTGVGIPAGEHEHIFDEFVQLGNPHRDRGQGLGLGLAIVRRTAALLGHEIRLASAPGRGSAFDVCVPFVGVEPRATSVATDGDSAYEMLAGAFIVAVDDEQDILFGMSALLAKYGCHVVCAQSARDAVRQLDDHLRTPDLIISDYRLGFAETGVDVIAAIREAANANIPAFIVTGSHSIGDASDATASGFPVLFKPLTERQLLAKVVEMLSAEAAPAATTD